MKVKKKNDRAKAATSRNESGKRISALRKALELSKSEFAALFRVSRGSESHWETGRFEPSAEKYFQMGTRALKIGDPKISYRWFWERAGLDVGDIYRLSADFASEIERQKESVPLKKHLSIPLLRDLRYLTEPKLAPAEAVEELLSFPSALAFANPDKVFSLRIPNDLSSLACAPHYDFYKRKIKSEGFSLSHEESQLQAPMFRQGDIVVIDSNIKDLSDLDEQIVALSFSVKLHAATVHSKDERWSQPVLHVGWLRRTTMFQALSAEKEAQSKLQAELLKSIGIEVPTQQINAESFYYLFPSPDEQGRAFASIVTNMGAAPKLSDEYKILGKVIGWISSSTNSLKGKSDGKTK